MLLLDVTIVSVALADLQRDLSASLSALQWVVDAYTLTLAGGLLTAATLGDRIGRRRVFIAGLVTFTAASLACAMARSAAQLDGFRAVQGLGAALLFGTALPLLGAAFPEPAARARAIGAFGATLSAATAVGPLVGGALVDGPGWRWIFLINVPVGLLTLLACTRLQESRPDSAPRADWAGALTLTTSLLALLLGLIRGNDDGWGSATVLGLLSTAAALMIAFVIRERTAAEPMLDLSLFARPAFTAVALQAFAVAGTLVAATYYVALYLQNVGGFSPFGTGLRVLPLTVAAFVAAPVTAVALRRVGTAGPLAVGLGLSAVGLLLLSRVDAGESWTVLIPGFVIAGLGLGMGSASSASAALSAVEPARAGMATGAVNTMRQVGAAAGVAALGALFEHDAGRRAAELLTGLPAGTLPAGTGSRLSEAIGSGLGRQVTAALPPAVHEQVSAIAARASADALSSAAVSSGLAALAATGVCLLLLAPHPRPARTVDRVGTVRTGVEAG
jgi:EmrB/QacA subfamily drug resistance transporter